MNRAELERMTLDELYQVAADRGIHEAPGLPREAVIERLLAEGALGKGGAAVTGAEAPAVELKPTVAEGKGSAEAKARETRATQNRRGPAADAGIPSSMAPDRPSEQDPATMARLYLEQGEIDRAVELYRELLTVRPDDESIAAGLAAAEGRQREAHGRNGVSLQRAPSLALPEEPIGMLDLEEPPEAYGVDECEVIAQNPHFLFVYWEVTDRGLHGARGDLGDEASAARLMLRVFATAGPGERGPEREWRDHPLDWNHGRRYIPSPRPGARVRAAVGLVTPSGLFAPIAGSSQVRVPPTEPAAHVSTEWMEVVPARTRGGELESIEIVQRGPISERGLAWPFGLGRTVPGPLERELPRPSSATWRWRPGSQS